MIPRYNWLNMQDRIGFNLFYTNTEYIAKDLEFVRINTFLTLPNKLKMFYSCFSASKYCNFHFNINVVMDKTNNLVPLETVCFGKSGTIEFISLSSFFDIEKLFMFEDAQKNNYIAIASSEDTGKGGILIGCDQSNYDMVYKYRWEEAEITPDNPFLLSKDIFEFATNLYTIQMWEDRFDRTKLYKNYNEDFWRVSED